MFSHLFEAQHLNGTGKSMPAAVSVTLHLVVVMVLAIVPMIYTDAIPLAGIHDVLVTPQPPPPPPPTRKFIKVIGVQKILTPVHTGMMTVPSEIPMEIPRIIDSGPDTNSSGDSDAGVPGGVPGGLPGGVPGGLGQWLRTPTSATAPAPKEVPVPPMRVRRGGEVQQADLIYAPKPAYPVLAKSSRIQGAVVMDAIISKDGTVDNLVVKSGHPLLIQAAMDAVRQWRYRPTLLNGEPVEVITTITVNFTLTGN
jgi:protein TonB